MATALATTASALGHHLVVAASAEELTSHFAMSSAARLAIEAVGREFVCLQRALVNQFRELVFGLTVEDFEAKIVRAKPGWTTLISPGEYWAVQLLITEEYEKHIFSLPLLQYYGSLDATVDEVFDSFLDRFDVPALVRELRLGRPAIFGPRVDALRDEVERRDADHFQRRRLEHRDDMAATRQLLEDIEARDRAREQRTLEEADQASGPGFRLRVRQAAQPPAAPAFHFRLRGESGNALSATGPRPLGLDTVLEAVLPADPADSNAAAVQVAVQAVQAPPVAQVRVADQAPPQRRFPTPTIRVVRVGAKLREHYGGGLSTAMTHYFLIYGVYDYFLAYVTEEDVDGRLRYTLAGKWLKLKPDEIEKWRGAELHKMGYTTRSVGVRGQEIERELIDGHDFPEEAMELKLCKVVAGAPCYESVLRKGEQELRNELSGHPDMRVRFHHDGVNKPKRARTARSELYELVRDDASDRLWNYYVALAARMEEWRVAHPLSRVEREEADRLHQLNVQREAAEAEIRLIECRQIARDRRASESEEARAARLERESARRLAQREAETPEEAAARKSKAKAKRKARLEAETPEAKRARLDARKVKDKARRAAAKAARTEAQREAEAEPQAEPQAQPQA